MRAEVDGSRDSCEKGASVDTTSGHQNGRMKGLKIKLSLSFDYTNYNIIDIEVGDYTNPALSSLDETSLNLRASIINKLIS